MAIRDGNRPPLDFHKIDHAECYIEYDRIMLEPDSPARDTALLAWAKWWAPALTNRLRPVHPPIG